MLHSVRARGRRIGSLVHTRLSMISASCRMRRDMDMSVMWNHIQMRCRVTHRWSVRVVWHHNNWAMRLICGISANTHAMRSVRDGIQMSGCMRHSIQMGCCVRDEIEVIPMSDFIEVSRGMRNVIDMCGCMRHIVLGLREIPQTIRAQTNQHCTHCTSKHCSIPLTKPANDELSH